MGKSQKILQTYLFEHLWLLDPSWDRATASPTMEKEIKNAVLGEEGFSSEYMQEIGRSEIQYRKSGGRHVIIELKRAGFITDTHELYNQAQKYFRKMKQLLTGSNRSNEDFEIICIIGRDLRDWSEPSGREDSKKTLKSVNTRVVTYHEMTGNALRAYDDYLTASQSAGKIFKVLETIDTSLKE